MAITNVYIVQGGDASRRVDAARQIYRYRFPNTPYWVYRDSDASPTQLAVVIGQTDADVKGVGFNAAAAHVTDKTPQPWSPRQHNPQPLPGNHAVLVLT